jgi:hypothetical protein
VTYTVEVRKTSHAGTPAPGCDKWVYVYKDGHLVDFDLSWFPRWCALGLIRSHKRISRSRRFFEVDA